MVARVLAQQVGQQLGQSVIVDNRPGANGNIGNALVAKAPADGYTVLYNTSSIALSSSLYKKMSYDVTRDLRPVALTAVVPLGLVVNPKVPANTVQELVKYAQDHKGKLSYGSAGNGNVTHLAAFQVVQHYNMDASHVPYKGSAPADVDLVAGQIDFMTDTINSVAPFIKDGRLRLLAVSTAGRIPNFPNAPTLAESGMTGFEAGAWQGVMVPAKTPVAIVERLNAELMKALRTRGAGEAARAGHRAAGVHAQSVWRLHPERNQALGRRCQKHGRVPGLRESKTMTILDGLSLTGIPPEGEALRAEVRAFLQDAVKDIPAHVRAKSWADMTRPSAASWVKRAGSA
jgi:tripartite-type tricarboxylate transporter receptor subunit TctC